MKKFSIILLVFLFTIVGLPNANAESYESYNIGDAVIFNGIGGHVIEDSDSSNSTVKVLVDGWNKTKDEWGETFSINYDIVEAGSTYETYFTGSSLPEYIESNLKDKSNYKIEKANLDLLDKFVDLGKYFTDWELSVGVVIFYGYNYEVIGNLPEFMLSKNINIYGHSRELPNIDNIKGNYYAYPGYSDDEESESFYYVSSERISDGVTNQTGNDIDKIEEFEKQVEKKYCEYGICDKQVINAVEAAIYVVTLSKTNIDSVERTKVKYEYDNSVTICHNDVWCNLCELLEDKKEEELKCENDIDKNFTINYNSNGGSEIETLKTTFNGDSNISLAQPTKDGFIFAGWYYDENLTNKVKEIKSSEGNVLYNLDVPKKYDESGCHIGYYDVTLYAQWEKKISSNDITISTNGNELDNVGELKVSNIEKTEELKNIFSNILSDFKAYEIDLFDSNGKKVQPNGKIKLIIPIPSEMNKGKLAVYRLDDKNIIEYDAIINGEYVEIETDHFSTYILGEKVIVKNSETGEKEIVKNPKTGDNVLLYFGFGLTLIMGSLVVVKKLKKVK